jgi:nucleoside-diphosphate-sugar epimerase
MTHAIVTGATGFIGMHFVRELLARGNRVTAFCLNNDPGISRLPPETGIVCEMLNLPQADTFYHLAWASASGPGRADALTQSENAGLTLQALEAAYRLGCKRFIALGTVYERLVGQILEANRFKGPDFYVLTKDYAHKMANQLAYKLGIGFVWCTICHPIGRSIKPEQLMAGVVSALKAKKSPPLGPCTALYDIVAVEDVARGLAMLGEADNLANREYYIGSGKPKPLREWLEEARRVLGAETPLGFGEKPDDGLRFEEGWFDISALQTDTGYAPQISFAEAVRNVAGEKEIPLDFGGG